MLHNWRGDFDHLLLIKSSSRGPAFQARVEGALDGARNQLGAFPQSRIIHLDGHASKDFSKTTVAKALLSIPSKARLLISAFNDPSAVGAL